MTACAPVPAPPTPAAEPPTPAADRFLVVNGARLRYRDEGCGPALLLVHGWTLDLEMWDPQVRALRNTFRLIRPDRRGHGRSDGIPAPQRDSEDLEALCDQLALARVAVVGMSQGARAALGSACAAGRFGPGGAAATLCGARSQARYRCLPLRMGAPCADATAHGRSRGARTARRHDRALSGQ